MGRCSIEGCRNANFKTRTTDKSVKYHPFPKNDVVRFKWMKALQRPDDWVPDNTLYVCSEHFQSTDYERDLKAELLNLPPKKILKLDAAPSLNLVKSGDGDPTPSLRKIKGSCENKENITNNSKSPCNGYIISYLGVPRLLITAPNSKSAEGSSSSVTNLNSQSRIIPLDQLQNGSTTAPIIPDATLIKSANNCVTNKNVFKLDELCRLCGSYSNRMTQVFDNIKCNYSEIIESHFPEIKVRRDDILPLQVCFKCDGTLLSWYQFYKTCNVVNRRFQSILKKLVDDSEVQEKPTVEEVTNQANSLQESCVKDEKMDQDDDFICTNVAENNDDPDIREIEIVEVSPEDSNNIEQWYPDNKCDMTAEDKLDVVEPMELKHAYLPELEEEEYVVEDESDQYLKEEDVDLSDDDSIGTGSDSSQETLEIEDLNGIKIDAKFAKEMRRRHRRRQASLTMRRMCHVCGKIFKYPESLRRHLKTVHSDERPFKCHLCSSSFNRNHNLTIHIKVVHQRQRIYVKKHVPRLCDYCGKVLLSVRSLEEHISSIHTKKALYECSKCQSTFYRKLSYDKHRALIGCDSKQPRKCNVPKVEEVFLKYCEICGLEFKKEHFYLKHKVKHMTSFTCALCLNKFDDAILLKDHVESEHPEEKPFECAVCSKKFKNKSLLNCHSVIHSGEKRYQCEYCALKFLKKKYLTTHILTHTGERPFVCTICGKGFKQSGDMRKHKAAHIRKQL